MTAAPGSTSPTAVAAGPATPGRRTVVVLDYGSGNLRSAERAVALSGVDVVVTDDLEQAAAADGLVVPGVGAFAACMAGLAAIGGGALVAHRVAAGRATLAICVGHQILFDAGVEHGVTTPGCGVWPGVVEQLRSPRLPHMGWNTVEAAEGSRAFRGVEDERFYFVHSYGVRALPEAPGRRVTWAEHQGEHFVAAVEEGPLWSTQFHPEKSGAAGTRLIENWVATL